MALAAAPTLQLVVVAAAAATAAAVAVTLAGAGGGGSYIAPSAIKVLAEVSGVPSPDDSPNGEIMITESPEPTTLALAGLSGLFLMLFRRQRSWVNP